MAEPWKVSTMLIALVMASLFVASFGLLISDVSTNYGATYNASTLSSFSKMQNLTEKSNEIKESVVTSSGKTGVLDVLGDFFAAGYQSLKISFASIGIMSSLVTDAVGSIGLGSIGSLIINSLILCIVILFIIAIVLKVLLKVDI